MNTLGRLVTIAALIVSGVALTGCGQSANVAGDTLCRDYLKQDRAQQRVTATMFAQERDGNFAAPNVKVVDGVMVASWLLCQIPANADEPIRAANVYNLFGPGHS